jgi:hypothetical protein
LPSLAAKGRKPSITKSSFEGIGESESSEASIQDDEDANSNSVDAESNSGLSDNEGERYQNLPRVPQWLDEDELDTDSEEDASDVADMNEQVSSSRIVSPSYSGQRNGIGMQPQIFLDAASTRFVQTSASMAQAGGG